MSIRLKSLIAAGGIAAALVLGASGAVQALTINFDTHVSGQVVSPTTVATLEATQMGSDVQIALTNTFNASFDTRLLLGYLAPVSDITGFSYVSGVQYTAAATGSWNDAGNQFNVEVKWATSNQGDRLEYNETATFKVLGASLSDMFGGSGFNPFAQLHIQGLATPSWCTIGSPDADCAGSAKYAGTIGGGGVGGQIPVPASLPLLLSALGAGILIRRRTRKSA